MKIVRKMMIAGLTTAVLLAPLVSSANAESRNGRMMPSRQMMRHHAMMHHRPMMMHRHHMMSRHHMMRRNTM